MSQAPTTFEEWWVGSYYKRFVEREGVPLYEGSILEDLAALLVDAVEVGSRGAELLPESEDLSLVMV